MDEFDSDSFEDAGVARCMSCGERFMGEEKAEVTLKADQSEYHRHLIIHQSCYDSDLHEVA